MLRFFISVCFFAFFLILSVPIFAENEKPAIEITPRGKILINKKVLGASLVRNSSDADEDSPSREEIEKESVLREEDVVEDAAEVEQIDLDFKNGQVNLTTKTSTGSAKRAVSKNDLLVKLDGALKKDDVDIRFNGEKFEIKQGDVEVETVFPIRIDPDASSLSIVTSKGEVLIKVLPVEAVEALLSSNIIDSKKQIDLVENSSSETNLAAYQIKARKEAKLFALFPMNFDVEVKVGVQSGENLSVKQPFFLRFLGFLFTK
jgi:hypothetical protein